MRAGSVGSGSPVPRSGQPPNDLAAVLESGAGSHVHTGLTGKCTGAGRCAFQVLEVLTGVRLDGVRDVRVVRDLAEVVE